MIETKKYGAWPAGRTRGVVEDLFTVEGQKFVQLTFRL